MSTRVHGYTEQQVARLAGTSVAAIRLSTASGLLAFRPHRFRRSDLVEADRHAQELAREGWTTRPRRRR